ncbi:DUF1538 domain-containing protein [Nesterenkonia sp. NBAIMH1]|uniref:DUF1538 domain-containing protein n=2 Tax=Nesterenkonia TaxID=57494 RepID=UPI001FEF48E2|nr:DUF1538 domain-containing protein [Nesterenkonia sp. NBAIMH1]
MALFQLVVFRQVPDDWYAILGGLVIVAVGIALFLEGLERSVFPVGKSITNKLIRSASLWKILPFCFLIGFAAVIAEPALLSVADQAEVVSEGQVDGFVFRLVIAVSVGAVMVLGALRVFLGWPLHRMLLIGYGVVLILTVSSPPEIASLAYDSGGVTTNIVTVPLIAAIGIGMASSITGRSRLRDGFGLVALCVMVPIVGVQLYGLVVYQFGSPGEAVVANGTEDVLPWWLDLMVGLVYVGRDVLPVILVVLFFQFVILRRRLGNPIQATVGFGMVVLGLYGFIVGLELGLIPMGRQMAEQLIETDRMFLVVAFGVLIGFAATMAEPALIAIAEEAEEISEKRLRAGTLRLLVACGVAAGIGIGVLRILTGAPFGLVIAGLYLLAMVLLLLAPKQHVPLAFDLGGVTTSEITVPLITALGIGLAAAVPGRDMLVDGFGLIAFASVGPVIAVLSYALLIRFSSVRADSSRTDVESTEA